MAKIIKEIIIIATKASVAFQTMPVTSMTSWKSTTPTRRAKIPPPHADQPIERFFGCQITNVSVNKKIIIANIVCNKSVNLH